jgi:hypothetical protein
VADLSVVLAGVALAMLAALFPVRIPRWKNSFTAGEIFIFLLLLMQGPAAATLAAAGEGLLGSWRTSRRWTSRLASPAMASLAMFAVGSALHAAACGPEGAGPTMQAWSAAGHDGQALALLRAQHAAVYGIGLPQAQQHGPRVEELFGQFGWVGITYAVSAAIASLLFLSFRQSGIGVLMAAAPVIGCCW